MAEWVLLPLLYSTAPARATREEKFPYSGGLRAVIDLAMQEEKGCVSLAEIAARQDISFNYLESIFSYLRRAGIVIGTAGSLGGYTLSKTAVEMNLYDILKVLEGELSMTGSEEPENETDLRSFLREEVWDVIDKNIEESLKKTTIKHMKEEFNKQDDSNFCAGL